MNKHVWVRLVHYLMRNPFVAESGRLPTGTGYPECKILVVFLNASWRSVIAVLP